MGADPTPFSDTWTLFHRHTYVAKTGGSTREPQGASPTVKQSLSQQNAFRKELPSLDQRPHPLIIASTIAIIIAFKTSLNDLPIASSLQGCPHLIARSCVATAEGLPMR